MTAPTANRLIHEPSPYLLQHAHNPVDWYPWGDEAFDRAEKEDRPVFLSIGYSTCHWCHVMERESFESSDIARLLNDHFVAIKVDREERPDIDHVYMSAVTAMTGQGGWPLSVFLTPQKKPFFGGTYFPPEPRWGQPGFGDVLMSVAAAWKNQREKIDAAGASLLDAMRAAPPPEETPLDDAVLDTAFRQWTASYDERCGGFGPAPKFAMGHNLSFLLRYAQRRGSDTARDMALHTLRMAARGGICDQLGGGFHRYSTDAQWQVPHFEKMLYDQALLVRAYVEAWQVSGDAEFADSARAACDYVLRDMTAGAGGFYSAEDADSAANPQEPAEKKEGAFYLWSDEEIRRLLSPEDAELFCDHFGVQPGGNAAADPHGEFTGKNILGAVRSVADTAAKFGGDETAVRSRLTQSARLLRDARSQRPRPALDDKIMTDWNGLMIGALAVAGAALDEPRYIDAACRAANFIGTHLIDNSGRLLHRYRDDTAGLPAHLDDYAFLINGLLDLYEADFFPGDLVRAHELAEQMVQLFWDEAHGGFFLTAEDRHDLPVRPKEVYDGALPSGASAAAVGMMRLHYFSGDDIWRNKAEAALRSCAALIRRHPSGYSYMLTALDWWIGPVSEFVWAAAGQDAAWTTAVGSLHKSFLPRRIILQRGVPGEDAHPRFSEVTRWAGVHTPVDGRSAIYVCQRRSCQRPLTTPEQFQSFLEARS